MVLTVTHMPPTKKSVRITRTVSLRPDQDQWIDEITGGGNVSALFQALIDAASSGAFDISKLKSSKGGTIDRAMTYLRAKEAGIMFEEDVAEQLKRWAAGRRNVTISRSKIHNDGIPFVADFSVERGGEVLCSVCCKSSSRTDRLQLALGEAIIGTQRTGRPVITVVPYFVEASRQSQEQFKALKLSLVELAGFAAALDAAVK
jgi:hypothetical protein